MLTKIINEGNRGHFGWGHPSKIFCADGFTVSVIAGGGTYCHPRPVLCYHFADHDMVREPDGYYETAPHDFAGPYDKVEVGFPSEIPEPWEEWSQFAEESEDPTGTIYSYVPVDLVRELVASHGGEVE